MHICALFNCAFIALFSYLFCVLCVCVWILIQNKRNGVDLNFTYIVLQCNLLALYCMPVVMNFLSFLFGRILLFAIIQRPNVFTVRKRLSY